MEAPDELLSWSESQIEIEIVSSLNDLEFVCEWEGSGWSARIETPVAEGERTHVIYTAANADRRLALLDVYGYLWLKEQPAPIKGSPWDPEQARPSKAPVPKASQSVADPEDLDPDQIAAVYGIRHPESHGD